MPEKDRNEVLLALLQSKTTAAKFLNPETREETLDQITSNPNENINLTEDEREVFLNTTATNVPGVAQEILDTFPKE